jgi:hypothetical protein
MTTSMRRMTTSPNGCASSGVKNQFKPINLYDTKGKMIMNNQNPEPNQTPSTNLPPGSTSEPGNPPSIYDWDDDC